MFVRVYQLGSGKGGPGSRARTIALVTVALAVGAFLLAFALMFLLALAAAGTVIGAGMMLYRRLTGRGRHEIGRGQSSDDVVLDPSLEVFPDRSSDRSARPSLPAHDSTAGA